MKVFVDANVLLDFLLQRSPFFSAAARLISRAESGQIEAYVSAISFNNVFYIARKEVAEDKARNMLRDLRRIFRVVPLDENVIDHAIELTVRDFEDAIQAVSAGRVAASYVVTRDARDFEKTNLQAFAPEEILALLDSAS